jgi:hypothetical protein
MSPGAETAVLHGYVLAGSDRLANFVEWGAMVASLIGAAVVAGQLGAGSTGRLFAAALLATLPTGIVQATSTMTDYVVAMWMICVASEALTVVRDPRVAPELGYLATAAGLAILSKPTAFGFLLPFALLVAFVLLRREGLGRMLLAAGGATLVVAALNAGYFTRNLVTYGHPLGDWRNLERNGNQGSLLGTIFSNTLRNASLHAGTPWEAVNHQLWRLVVGTHFKLGLDVNDPNRSIEADFRILRPRPSELRTGSLLHAVLAVFVVTLVAVQAARRRWPDSGLRVYTLVVAVSFVTFSSSMKFSVFADRYHMPFFVLMAPLIAAVLDRLCRAWVLAAMAVGLLAYSWPWLARLEPRPLFPRKDGVSILDTDRMDLYFSATSTETTELLRDTIQGNACQVVGVMLGGDSPEYPLWAFLGAPRSGVRLEWIVAGTPSARYAPVDFQPCAVVCDQSCPSEWTTVRDLPLRLDVSGIRLFMAP